MTLRPYRGLKILLYKDPTAHTIGYEELHHTLEALIPRSQVELREEFLSYALKHWTVGHREAATTLASLRVVDVLRCEPVGKPLIGEIAYEERALAEPHKRPMGILYEGYLLQSFLLSLIPRSEQLYGQLHTVITSRLLVTKEPDEGRAHARTIILGNPTLISTTGLVEAPALPPEVYMRLQLLSTPDMQRLAIEEARQRLRDRALSIDDERLTEVITGYILQGVFYYLFGEPFCTDADCMFYNAHTHEELINAQIKSGRLCKRHQSMLSQLG